MSEDAIQYLVLDRCDPTCNMARYIEPSLFGNPTLIREWGRIGLPGQRRVELHENQSQAVEALETWLQRKRRRGYELRDGLPWEWAKPAAAPAKAGRTAHGKGGLVREGIFFT
jgi:predicted DNA-binding WGR domain protein